MASLDDRMTEWALAHGRVKAKHFEVTIEYGPFMDFNIMPVTRMEDAFPVNQRVYG